MITRSLNPLNNNSYFLFGPRGTGKSTWLQMTYTSRDSLYLDLLSVHTTDELMTNPQRFLDIIQAPENRSKIIIIDEIQKMPKLLDYVHQEIVRSKRVFVLTGSSARKMKQQGMNLLAGRALFYNFFPFSTRELMANQTFNLSKALERGALPDAYQSNSLQICNEYLMTYVHLYLEKEIQQERWVRNIEPFRKFLAISAQMNGKIINKVQIAKEVGVSDHTITNYYEILEDTLIGIEVPPFHQSLRKSQRASSKFYFIDTGIKRALDRTLSVPILQHTSMYGEFFEHWVFLELYKNASYLRLDWKFSYLLTKDNAEIDFIIDRPGKSLLLLEIKSKTLVEKKDARHLFSLGDDIEKLTIKAKKPRPLRFLLSQDSIEQDWGTVKALHWLKALELFFHEGLI